MDNVVCLDLRSKRTLRDRRGEGLAITVDGKSVPLDRSAKGRGEDGSFHGRYADLTTESELSLFCASTFFTTIVTGSKKDLYHGKGSERPNNYIKFWYGFHH
jgi:hypothetical protein